jgi:hypothetical protein
MKQINNLPFVVGLGLLAVPVFALFISSLFFVCGSSINPFVFPLSILLAIGLMYRASKENVKQFLVSAAVYLLIIAVSLLLSSVFYDYSRDGNTYHQDIILQLKNGWNPFYEHHASNARYALLVDHYTKGMETISATIYSATGAIELGKAVNFIFLFSALSLLFHFLSGHFPFLSLRKKIFLSILFPLCPVVVNQIFTFYIDGAVYLSLLILISTLFNTVKKATLYNYLIIGFIVLFSASIKFNLFFWVLFTLFFFMVYIVILKKYELLKKLIVTASIGALLGVFLVGFNPYLTNTVDHQNPFYPLMGEGKTDIMSYNTPPVLQDKSRGESVFISFFSFPTYYDESPQWAFPTNLLKFSKEDLVPIGITNARLGGFGLFFSWILILSVILYFSKGVVKNKQRKKYNVFLFLLFLSLFILPHAWWSRYFPFFYIFPLIMLLYTECDRNNAYVTICRNIIYLLLIVNIGLSIACSIAVSYVSKKGIDNSLTALSKSSSPIRINLGGNVGYQIKLDERSIQYEETLDTLETTVLYSRPEVTLHSEQFEVVNGKWVEKQRE